MLSLSPLSEDQGDESGNGGNAVGGSGPVIRRWATRGVHRGLALTARSLRVAHKAVTEVSLSLYGPELEPAANDHFYGGQTQYRTSAHQRRGLFPFEARMLEQFFPRPPARLFVPGAGAGREVLALVERGYQIDGLEPVPALVQSARAQLGAHPLGQVHQGTVQAWAQKAEGPYHGIVTGWGMWTHLLHHQERVAVLRAFRAACPTGPVLLSFWRAEPTLDQHERKLPKRPLFPAPGDGWGQFRRRLREALLRRPPLERGTGWREGMFFHLVDELELTEEGAAAGYRVGYYERDGSRYPHAVLIPLSREE